MNSMVFHPLTNELYATAYRPIGTPKDLLVKINPATGDTTHFFKTGKSATTTGMAFDESGRLFVTFGNPSQNGQLIEMNTTTGAVTDIGTTTVKNLIGLSYAGRAVSSIDDQESELIPKSLSLSQNYPNPFNAETRMNYRLGSQSVVRFEVFNLLGERVFSQEAGLLEAGTHSLFWRGINTNGNAAPGGVYFLKVSAVQGKGEHSKIMKMVLLK